jgi:microcystin degradation protein MlrC
MFVERAKKRHGTTKEEEMDNQEGDLLAKVRVALAQRRLLHQTSLGGP